MNIQSQNLYERGFQKSKAGDYLGAINDFDKAIEITPNVAEFFVRRAQAKLFTGNIEHLLQAYSDYSHAIKLEPQNAEALAGLGSLQIQLNPDEPDGLSNLEKAAEIDPTKSSYFNIGIAKYKLNDFEGMHNAMKRFITEQNPTGEFLGEAFYFDGLALLNLNRFSEAIESFSNAIKNRASTNYLWAFFNRAISYCAIGELQNAIMDLTSVLKIKPDNVDALKKRGEVYCHLGRYQESIADLYSALKLTPDGVPILEELGKTLVFAQQYQRGLEVFNKLISLQPNHSHHYQNRGTCYLALQSYNDAIDDYNRSIKLNSENAYAYYYRGLAYFYLQNNQACQDWRRAYEMGCNEAKTWMDEHCSFKKQLGIEVGDGLWIPLDQLSSPDK